MQSADSCVWLISLGIMFSRSVRITAWISAPLPFLAKSCSLVGLLPWSNPPVQVSLQDLGSNCVFNSTNVNSSCFTHRKMTIPLFTVSKYTHDLVYSVGKKKELSDWL